MYRWKTITGNSSECALGPGPSIVLAAGYGALGLPGGESADQVRARLTRVMTRVRESGVDRAICFAHGHALRVLALCWLDFPIAFGQSFPLNVGSVSIMGHEKESAAVLRWNS